MRPPRPRTCSCDWACSWRGRCAEGRRHELPRLAELVAEPEFDALRRFLEQRVVDVGEVQAAIYGLVKQVEEAVRG